MPPHSQNSPLEPGKIWIHSPFLHTRLPQMHPLINYAYRTPRLPPSSTSGIATSHTLTSPPPVSSMTQTKKTYRPPYQQFHVMVPPFAHRLAEHKHPSVSPTTPLPIAPLCQPLQESTTMSSVVTNTLARLKRSFESLVPSDTEGHPAKTTKQQCSSRASTKSGSWNLSHLPLSHHLPLTLPFRHLLYCTTHKSQ